MTSRKQKIKEPEVDIRGLVDQFDDQIEDIKEEFPNKEDRFNAVIKILNTPYNMGVEYEEQKDDVKAAEQYFLCLGLLKKVLESDLFKFNRDNQNLKQLIVMFDLPCSTRMSRMMFESGNYDEVYHMSERILAIDPGNKEAKDHMDYIRRAEKDKDWRRLKDAKDVQSYITEYYNIQQEREQKQKKQVENKLVHQLNHERQSDPAKFILHAIETIIKLCLMIPYMIYKKLGEPLIVMFYELYLFPLYESVLQKVPFSAPVIKLTLAMGSKFMGYFTSIVEFFSGQGNVDASKQKPKTQINEDDGGWEKVETKERHQEDQYGSLK